MSNAHARNIAELDARDVKALLDAGRILLVDVREPAEYAAERIHGALLYPLSTFDASALPPDDAREIVFHCGSGKRSLAAAQKRLAAGASQARHMSGGIGAWCAAGLPTIRLDPATGAIRDATRG
jgi:rhodanese-related sulfurtransferase